MNLQQQISFWSVTLEDFAFNNAALKYLDLSNNGILFHKENKVGKQAFANCNNLTNLILSKNQMRFVTEERFLQLFGSLIYVNFLGLADCGITNISTSLFKPFPLLRKLNLKGNQLTEVKDGVFNGLIYLKHLNLADNKITHIDTQTFSALLRENLCFLFLSDNPWTCECQLNWFTLW